MEGICWLLTQRVSRSLQFKEKAEYESMSGYKHQLCWELCLKDELKKAKLLFCLKMELLSQCTLSDSPVKVSFAAWRTGSSRFALLRLSSVSVASSAETLFSPPSAHWAYNQHSVSSCWAKWTQEYLKAYHLHCITQNSFCLCYAHLSCSWSTFGMAGWSFCQRRIGRDCVQPLQYALPPSLWIFQRSREAARQQSMREVIGSWWWDELTFIWPQCCFYFPVCALRRTQKPNRASVEAEMPPLFLE